MGTRVVGECWAGGLPGLGSSMIRGPYAGWQLGQTLDLPAISTSGPLVLLDAGPEPGRWLKTLRPPAPATNLERLGARWLRASRPPGRDRRPSAAARTGRRGARRRARAALEDVEKV